MGELMDIQQTVNDSATSSDLHYHQVRCVASSVPQVLDEGRKKEGKCKMSKFKKSIPTR